MVTISDVKWGSYRNTEGPLVHGSSTTTFQLSGSPSESDKLVYCTTVVEGGNYAAVNMYDRGIVSLGLIQFIEGLGEFSVSSLLGAVAEVDRSLLQPIDDLCKACGCVFMPSALSKGQWRFSYPDSRGSVDTTLEQQKLFYLDATGEKGTWTPASVSLAKRWAVAFASIWDSPTSQIVQRNFTAKRMLGFASVYARTILDNAPPSTLGRAFTAAYLSYAVNNPKWASDALKTAIADQGNLAPWSPSWLTHVLKYLTFEAKIAIYPARYRALRPALEQLYGLDLPDFAEELAVWTAESSHALVEPKDIQQALIDLGYDLGPSKADGQWGKKSAEALLLFEQQHGVVAPDGKPDPITLSKLREVHDRDG